MGTSRKNFELCFASTRRLRYVLDLLAELQAEVVDMRVDMRMDLDAVLAEDPEARLSDEPEWWGHQESSAEVLAWVDAVEAERSRLEVALCHASTLLINVWDLASVDSKTAERTRVYVRAEKSHRKHRERDRAQVLRNIKRIQEYLEKGGAEYKRFAALRRQVRAISIEELIRDRGALPQV